MVTQKEARRAALTAMQKTIKEQEKVVATTKTLAMRGPELERLFRMQDMYHAALITYVPKN